jgi:hypothetical protein
MGEVTIFADSRKLIHVSIFSSGDLFSNSHAVDGGGEARVVVSGSSGVAAGAGGAGVGDGGGWGEGDGIGCGG